MTPRRPLRGTLEIVTRYSRIHLNDQDVLCGAKTNFRLAVNWISPGNQLRVQAIVIHLDPDKKMGHQNTISRYEHIFTGDAEILRIGR